MVRYGRLKAFTLIELLVVIAVIALLISILIPSLRMAKEHARRVNCLSNIHQALAASMMYAGENAEFLPVGSIIDKAAPGYQPSWDSADWLSLMNFKTMLMFHDQYGLDERLATCATARNYFESQPDWLDPLPASYAYVETSYIGWICWAGRGDFIDLNTNKKFITPKKTTGRASTNTLITCFCYDRYSAVGPSGANPNWYSTHVGGRFLTASGRPMPEPDGLAAGMLDGSAKFVRFKKLTPVNHEGEYIVYHYDNIYH